MQAIDAERFNAFERSGWAENSNNAYDRVFGGITGHVLDVLCIRSRTPTSSGRE